MKKRQRNDFENTTNRAYFNKLYKLYLELQAEIRCSYCQYNRNENRKTKSYGGRIKNEEDRQNIIFPNWKLISKKEKQWMDKLKTYDIEITKNQWNDAYWLSINF